MATKDYKRVPANALIMNMGEECSFKFSEKDGDDGKKVKTMKMTGYSGGVIQDHWYWGNLIIDIAGMSFPKKAYPILRQHSIDNVIGHSPKPSTEGNKLQFDDVTLCKTEDAEKFVSLSEDGFPFEASIYARPTTVESVDDGDTVEVNGQKFKGPGMVWRKSIFKECSVCVFGADSNTSATAMSEGSETLDLSEIMAHTDKNPAEESDMSHIDKFKEEHPEDYDAFVKKIVDDATAKFSESQAQKDKEHEEALANKDSEIAKLSQSNTSKEVASKTLEDKLLDLEKKLALQNEASMAAEAKAIIKEKFSESGLPDRIREKFSGFINYTKFITDDKLDTVKFSEHVDAEIKEAQDMFGESKPSVNGVGTAFKQLGNTDQFTEKDGEDAAISMLKLAGLYEESK